MNDCVVWLDSEKAMIFNLKADGIEKSHIKKSNVDHHTHNKKANHGDPHIEKYYRDLSEKLSSVDHLLILGPGMAKTHFKTHLDNHESKDLAKAVVGVENSDHPTDNEILAEARKFFKTYDLYNRPIRQN